MTTMSDEGDRMCPLCAEDMDLTDQQLKPCKCGYEICVWCWHHIIDMAEKDDMEGRCPACRTPYDKERIVGMAANCGRMVSEINAEKKHKSQKVKPKTSVEAKKHLSGLRVIQRNLVYIVGLPSNLCDETLLERREFFGQYGKVLKVSVSRPASPSGQQASNNNTCSGYITYAKEEEAVRCIQAVHNFVLEGKPLRACFGTTKYCHAWLRNMTCSNPDCLYLHDIGSQEDSFTKDEIISAYTRSRVPQIASNNLQRRLGSVLPPPVDDFSNCGTVSGKHVLKSAANNTVSQVKAPPNGNVGKPAVLPAAASWGLRVSNCRTPSMSCSQSSIKQKVDTATSACLISSVNESTKQMSPWHDDPVTASRLPDRRHVIPSDGISRPIESTILGSRMDCRSTISDVSSEVLVDAVSTPADSAWNDDVPTESKISEERYAIHLDSRSRSLQTQRPSIGGECQTSGSDVLLGIVPDAACTSGILNSFSSSPPPPAPEVKDRCITVPLKDTSTVESTSPQGLSRRPISSDVDAISYDYTGVNGHIQSLCLGLSSVNIESHLGDDYLNVDQHQSSSSNLRSTGMPGNPTLRLQERYSEHGIVCLASTPLRETSMSSDMHISDLSSESQKQVSPTANEMNGSLAAGDEQVHRFPGVTNQTSPSSYLSQSLNITNNLNNSFWRNDVEDINPLVNGDSSIMDKKFNKPLSPFKDNELTLFSRHKDEDLGSYSNLGRGFDRPESCTENVKCLRSIVDVANIDETACMDMGESQIASDILSLDFDPWDDSLSSDNNFAKLLSESHKKDESFKLSSSHRLQNSDQSRFSFARQENLASALESSLRDSGHSGESCFSLKGLSGYGFQNGFLSNAFECPKLMTNSNPTISSDRISGVSRAKISAPPGFSMPSKAPPPGFSSQDRYDQAQGATYSGNHLLASSYFGNQYQEHLIATTGDVEFIDPAILAVGKGRTPLGVNNSSLGLRPAFPAHFSTLENDLRLQLLMQQPMSSHQNLIADHIGDRFLPPNDAFITSQLLAQNFTGISPFSQMSLQHPRNSYISGSQWDDWNLQTGNDAGMAEILKNERFRLNNYFPGSEEHKFYIPSSGDLYSRAFGM